MRGLVLFVLAVAACAPPPAHPSIASAPGPSRAMALIAPGPRARANATLTYVPSARALVLLGGEDPTTGTLLDDAWRLDASTLTWTLLPFSCARAGHTAHWGGGALWVFGGRGPRGPVADLVRIDGALLDARALPAFGEPAPRVGHCATWTGRELLVFGGRDANGEFLANGARYDIETGIWRALPSQGAPHARSECVLTWKGDEVLLWGGTVEDAMPAELGAAAFDPQRDAWRSLARQGAPAPSAGPRAAWSDGALIVSSREGLFAYDPRADAWRLIREAPPRGAVLIEWPEGGVVMVGGARRFAGEPGVVWVSSTGDALAWPEADALDQREDPLVAAGEGALYVLFGVIEGVTQANGMRLRPH